MTHYAACLANVASLAAGRDPVAITEILAEYGALMIEIIEAEQGFPARRVGDVITAYWGGLPSQTRQQTALHACRTALRQLKALAASPRLAALGLKLNIGICSDDPAGCAVLCRACPQADVSILVSRSTRELCAEAFRFEELKTPGAPPAFILRNADG